MQDRNRREHKASRTQVRSGKYNCDEAERKDDRANHPDQSWSVVLIPRRRLSAQRRRASKCEQTAGHEGAEEDLVDSHVRFGGAGSRAKLCCLLRRVGIVHDLHMHLDELIGE